MVSSVLRCFVSMGLLLFVLGPAHAQSISVVSVDGRLYHLDAQGHVSGQTGKERLDEVTVRKVSITASVSNDLLKSPFYFALFSVRTRALILSADASGRLQPPWMLGGPKLKPSDTAKALAAMQKNAHAWLDSNARNAKEIALTAVRQEYARALGPYRQTAAIHRAVVHDKVPLTFELAEIVLRNDVHLATIAAALALEAELTIASATPSKADSAQVGQALEAEIRSSLLAGFTFSSLADIDALNRRLVEVAYKTIPETRILQAVRRPSLIALAPRSNLATASTYGSKPTAQVSASIKQASLVSRLPPNLPGMSGASNLPPPQTALQKPKPRPLDPPSHAMDYNDNLKTYSSKPYHNSLGWAFDPMSAGWRNPTNPNEFIPAELVTCCDDTGLAFPNDAIEARKYLYWDLATVDPNCGRLYECDDVGPDVPPTSDNSPPPDPVFDKNMIELIKYTYDYDAQFAFATVVGYIQTLPTEMRARARDLHHAYRKWLHGAGPRPTPGFGAQQPHVSRKWLSPTGTSSRSDSDITGFGGLRSRQTKLSKDAALRVVSTYKTVPGGITLEGVAENAPNVTKLEYVPQLNVFLINDDLVYIPRVPREEVEEISAALAKGDLLGVSLTDTQHIVFGSLPRSGRVTLNLKLADRILGGIVYEHGQHIGLYAFPQGSDAKSRTEWTRGQATQLAIYFNFSEYGFETLPHGELKRNGLRFSAWVVPLSFEKSATGVQLPDLNALEDGRVPAAYANNVKLLHEHFEYFAREPIVSTVIAYGELAALLRHSRRSATAQSK